MVDRPWDCKVLHCTLLDVTVLIFLYEKYSGSRFLGMCISLLCSSPHLVLTVKTHKNLSFEIPGNFSNFFFAIIIIVSINITMSKMLNQILIIINMSQPAFAGHFQDTRRTLIFHLVHFRDTHITVTLHTLFTWALSIYTWVFPMTPVL